MTDAVKAPITTRTLGHTGWQVPTVGLGCWALGDDYGQLDETEAEAIIRSAVDTGVRLFDTADGYGQGISELRLGRYLQAADEVLVATKVGNFARALGEPLSFAIPEHIVQCCHASLYRLRRDHIDLYQCHIPKPEHPEIFIETFEKLKEQGLIRAYGISTDNVDSVAEFCRLGQPAAVQLAYNMLNRRAEKKLLPYCQEQGIGVMVRSPLQMGLLTGKFTGQEHFADRPRQNWNDGNPREHFQQAVQMVQGVHARLPDADPVQLALRFCSAHPAVTCVIPGAKSVKQLHGNCAAWQAELSAEEAAVINECCPSPVQGGQ